LPSLPFKQPVIAVPLFWSLGIDDVVDCCCELDVDGADWLGVVSCANATVPASKHAAVRVRTFRIDSPPCLSWGERVEVAYTVRYELTAWGGPPELSLLRRAGA